MAWLNRIFQKKAVDERIGQAWFEEVLPQYHDHAKTTNKTIWIVQSIIKGDAVKASCIGSTSPNDVVMKHSRVLTQDGVPVKFGKKQKVDKKHLCFERDGYAVGDMYYFENLGFLGDISNLCSVILVTDQLVLFEDTDGSHISKYSYDELSKLSPTLM